MCITQLRLISPLRREEKPDGWTSRRTTCVGGVRMYSASRYFHSSAIIALFVWLYPVGSIAQDVVQPLNNCTSPPSESGKSRLRFDSTPLMLVAHELEEQGEGAFHLQYSSPTAECLVETFKVADATVTMSYNPFAKGLSTLAYRAAIDRPGGKSEVLILYSGTAGFVSGGDYVFHVSEEKNGVISWYAMYRDPPSYPVVKHLIEQVVKGDAKPLLAVRWPKGAKEGEIVVFDSKKLKK